MKGTAIIWKPWGLSKAQLYGSSILLGSYIVRIQESKIGISQDFTKMIIVQA